MIYQVQTWNPRLKKWVSEKHKHQSQNESIRDADYLAMAQDKLTRVIIMDEIIDHHDRIVWESNTRIKGVISDGVEKDRCHAQNS